MPLDLLYICESKVGMRDKRDLPPLPRWEFCYCNDTLSPTLSPTLSRKKRRYTSKAPSAGEGVDRGEIKHLCLIQYSMIFSTQQAKISTLDSHIFLIYCCDYMRMPK